MNYCCYQFGGGDIIALLIIAVDFLNMEGFFNDGQIVYEGKAAAHYQS